MRKLLVLGPQTTPTMQNCAVAHHSPQSGSMLNMVIAIACSDRCSKVESGAVVPEQWLCCQTQEVGKMCDDLFNWRIDL